MTTEAYTNTANNEYNRVGPKTITALSLLSEAEEQTLEADIITTDKALELIERFHNSEMVWEEEFEDAKDRFRFELFALYYQYVSEEHREELDTSGRYPYRNSRVIQQIVNEIVVGGELYRFYYSSSYPRELSLKMASARIASVFMRTHSHEYEHIYQHIGNEVHRIVDTENSYKEFDTSQINNVLESVGIENQKEVRSTIESLKAIHDKDLKDRIWTSGWTIATTDRMYKDISRREFIHFLIDYLLYQFYINNVSLRYASI